MRSIGRLVASVSLLVPGILLAQGGGTLSESERSYVARILEPVSDILAKSRESAERQRAKYVADLRALEIDVARSGDLEAVKAVRAEREAWEGGRSTPGFEAGGRFSLSKVATVRRDLDAALRAGERQAKRALEQETIKAIKALDRMKVELTRATRIDAALELEKQIQSLKGGTFEVVATVVGQGVGGRQGGVPPRLLGDTTSRPADATKDRPFINSLGMPFVPIKDTGVLLCVWETRVKDFGMFVKDSGYTWSQKATFEQTPEDPVVMVNWDDANAFCAWLSIKEGREYRLPTDEEWDTAVGKEKYPWGDDWPPPRNVENIGGEEVVRGRPDDPKGTALKGYKDNHPRTAPVGSYKANKAGLCDMGGNVREWVQDWYADTHLKKSKAGGGSYEPKADEMADIQEGNVRRVLRGGYWALPNAGFLASSSRVPVHPDARSSNVGFRCAIVVSSP
ncbi:MAG TPA: SUMF1/EgtB/PvdO family nonheme iron enzyme [Verrucomicrobiae bacterium]|nr:SUMF1/EgtB/PvdO family nonheme iron enzyme [Verrucomicrobiae bacterium]